MLKIFFLTMTVALLVLAVGPPLRVNAQGPIVQCYCQQVTTYTCLLRNGQYVCGYLTYLVCPPRHYRYTPYGRAY